MTLRFPFASILLVLALLGAAPIRAEEAPRLRPEAVLDARYRLVLDLVRHTATYSPPVAARSFAYFGVTAYEATASGRSDLVTLAGQLNGLKALPTREAGAAYDEAVVLDAALATATRSFFSNTGPSGQHAMDALAAKLQSGTEAGLASDVARRSRAYGAALADAVAAWADADGGARIENMGFPLEYALNPAPGHWRPTSAIAVQQAPLLPNWGRLRTFVVPSGETCALPPPPPYSTETDSAFYREAAEVHDVGVHLTDEQRAVARFWSDDAMLSTTPPGHWIQIAFQLFEREATPIEKRVDVLARLGVATSDAFVSCWSSKFQYDLVRPVTYIRANIDPAWTPLLITPPFPEYPSGHSTASAAMAEVMTQAFGESYAFEDASHIRDGLPARRFPNFRAAAEEAAVSRLYGGIHFRTAIARGLEQGRCVAPYAIALKTRK